MQVAAAVVPAPAVQEELPQLAVLAAVREPVVQMDSSILVAGVVVVG